MGGGDEQGQREQPPVHTQLRRFAQDTEPTEAELERVAARLEEDDRPARRVRPWVWGSAAGLAAGAAALVIALLPAESADRFRGAGPSPAIEAQQLEGVERWELERAWPFLEEAARSCPLSASGVRLRVSAKGVVEAPSGQGELGACLERRLPDAALVREAPEGTERRFRLALEADAAG